MDSATYRRFSENWVVDFGAAIFTGFAIWCLEYSFAPAFIRSFDATEMRRLLVKVLALPSRWVYLFGNIVFEFIGVGSRLP